MSETPGNILSPFSKQASQFTWLIYDVFLLFMLFSLFMFYKDFSDEKIRELIRLFLVYCVGVFLISALHLLAYHRHDDAQQIKKLNGDTNARYEQFSAWCSYGIFSIKIIFAGIFVYLAMKRGIILGS